MSLAKVVMDLFNCSPLMRRWSRSERIQELITKYERERRMNMYVHGPEDNETPLKVSGPCSVRRPVSDAMAEYERVRNPWAGKWADGTDAPANVEPIQNENHGQTFYDVGCGPAHPSMYENVRKACNPVTWNGRHMPAKSILGSNKTPHISQHVMTLSGHVIYWRCELPFSSKYEAGYGRTQLAAYDDWLNRNRQWAHELT